MDNGGQAARDNFKNFIWTRRGVLVLALVGYGELGEF